MRRDYRLRLLLVAAMSLKFVLGVAGSPLYYYVEAYQVGDRVTADAAHELRTPLAVLNLRLQQARMRNVID